MDMNRLLNPELLIPIVAILMPVALLLIVLYFVARFQERKHQTIIGLLEKGLPVPRELLRQQAPRREGSPLLRAMTFVGIGVGTSALLGAMFQLEHGLWAAGLIPLCIGVAQLIALRLEPPRPQEPAEPTIIDLT
jgi:hypothetical protein